MQSGVAMEELDRYECFGVPPHAWMPPAELAAIVMRARVPVRAMPPDVDFLGAEAFPSPLLDGIALDA
jgi:hypothetical protein